MNPYRKHADDMMRQMGTFAKSDDLGGGKFMGNYDSESWGRMYEEFANQVERLRAAVSDIRDEHKGDPLRGEFLSVLSALNHHTMRLEGRQAFLPHVGKFMVAITLFGAAVGKFPRSWFVSEGQAELTTFCVSILVAVGLVVSAWIISTFYFGLSRRISSSRTIASVFQFVADHDFIEKGSS